MSELEVSRPMPVLKSGEWGLFKDGVFLRGKAAEEELKSHVSSLLMDFRNAVIGDDEDMIREFDGTLPSGTAFSLIYESHPATFISHFCTESFLKEIFSGKSIDAGKIGGVEALPTVKDVEIFPYQEEGRSMTGAIVHIEIKGTDPQIFTGLAEVVLEEIDTQGHLMTGHVSGVLLPENRKLDLRPRAFT